MDAPRTNPDLYAWETNAEYWDDYMGDESNVYHRELVRPAVTELLDPSPGERILDIACGNGNYSAFLADMGGGRHGRGLQPEDGIVGRSTQEREREEDRLPRCGRLRRG